MFFLVIAVLSIYTCYGVIVEFLGDPISMETTLKQETDGTRMFPDVIICLRHIQNRSQGVTLAAAMKEAEARFSQSLEISKIQINNKGYICPAFEAIVPLPRSMSRSLLALPRSCHDLAMILATIPRPCNIVRRLTMVNYDLGKGSKIYHVLFTFTSGF